MKRLALLLAVVSLTSCTTLYENGQKVASFGSDLEDMRYRSPNGTVLEAKRLSNSTVHRAVGRSVSEGAIGIGTAVSTSGIIGILKP